jgi:hypothetical protein
MHQLLVTALTTALLGLVVCGLAFGYATLMGYIDSLLGPSGPVH